MPPRARTNLLRLLAPCVVLVVGCSGPPPNSVSSNVSNGPDDQFATRILTPADSKRVLEIMRESVNGPTDDPARPAGRVLERDAVQRLELRCQHRSV